VWDGTERVDKLLIDYMGADDTTFNRAVSRKTLCAATARIMQPGIKFDYMMVLIGTQGIGKSSLFSKLAGKWFSDSLTTVQNKEAYEQLQGVWVIEIGELAATRKADVESLKHFLSKQTDSFRVAYGKHVSEFPRQCIFVGTTNDREFLKDRTGNRRFWPVNVTGAGEKNIWTDLSQYEIDQIWAEALLKWQEGEPLYLDRDMEEEARRIQESHTEESPLVGMIQEYLDKPLPANWEQMSIYERRNHLSDPLSPEGTVQRDKVCSMEIWCEVMGNDQRRFPAFERREINEILRRIPGWEPSSTIRFGFVYGRQRGYLRRGSVNRVR
jgi:predicted P-loop ATPase